MIEPMTLARPYARAAFDYAASAGTLDAWGKALAQLAAVSQNAKVAALLRDPAKTGQASATAIASLCDADAPAGLANFLQVMADNARLNLLPEINQLFAQLKAAREATVDVEVTSALDVTAAEAEQLAQAMAKRLDRSVTITTKTDPSLLGGAVIRAGDLVIDGSVRGRLNKLAGALTP
jgi:F-type H+-transporting ATPase subunit delta